MIEVFHRDSPDTTKGEAELVLFLDVRTHVTTMDLFKWMRETHVRVHMSDHVHHALTMRERDPGVFHNWNDTIMLDNHEALMVFKLTWHNHPQLAYQVVLDLT